MTLAACVGTSFQLFHSHNIKFMSRIYSKIIRLRLIRVVILSINLKPQASCYDLVRVVTVYEKCIYMKNILTGIKK